MSRTTIFALLTIALATAGVMADEAIDFAQQSPNPPEFRSAPGHPTTQGFDPAAVTAQQIADYQRLVQRQAPSRSATGIQIQLTQQDRIDLGLEPCTDCSALELQQRKRRVGAVKSVSAIDFRGLTPRQIRDNAEFAGGTIQATADGFTWTLISKAPGAVAQRFGFEEFDLPAGAEVWVYGDSQEAFGPFTGLGRHGDGQFWANSIHSERAFIQVHYSGPTDLRSLQAIRFTVPEVAYQADIAENPDGDSVSTLACGNASCVNDGAGGASAALRDAVGHMRWISGPYLYICTGTLIADTDNSSEKPYFLTANHCISRGKDARNLEVYFNYTSGCSPSGSSTSGASVRATGNSGDYTLLELKQNPPNGTGYLGWSNAPVANSGGTTLSRVHHPQGAPQSYSQHSVNTSAGTCNGLPRGAWIYSRDTNGATDGGSSGSAVVNGSGAIVGQLTGACGTNLNNVCDSNSNATIDGAFAHYFSSVESYLDPDGGGGDPPGGACDNDGTCEPGEDCSNCGNDCAGKLNGNPANRYCCGDGTQQSAEGNGSVCDGNY